MSTPPSQINAATKGLTILVVDDEKNIRLTLSMCLEGMGCQVSAVATGDAALEALARTPHHIAFVDLKLAQASGLDLIPRLLAVAPDLSIVVITAYATFETAVEAIRRGARSYLPKPFTPAQIRQVVEEQEERRALTRRVQDLEDELGRVAPEADLGTASPCMRAVLELASRAAASEATVLLRGESGTGKGVVAHAIHRWSPRRDSPFVVVNCPTLSQELLSSELFGHARGAFTGAVRDQEGRVEAAEGGTLFLDEIAELSLGLQAKLLRFLQDKQFERVGENRTRTANVRLIAATHRNIEEDVQAGRFREDLWYRLNVLELTLPPLRERVEDILSLAHRFLAHFCRTAGRPTPELSRQTEAILRAHAWPGNIRELRNAMERITILWPHQVVEPEALGARWSLPEQPRMTVGGDHTLEELEREHIARVLARTRTQEEAARILGVDVSTLWRKRKKQEEG